MKSKASIWHHWQATVTLLFAVGVFCFWGFLRPWQVLERESMQLFLWNTDYFLDRIAVPGGLARYMGELLGQFFNVIKYGSFVTALLLTAIQWLTWLLLRRMGGRWKNGLYGLSFLPAIVLCWLLCDMDVQLTLPIAVLLVLLMTLALPRERKVRLLCLMVLVPVAYWLVGPVAFLLVLLPFDRLHGRAVAESAGLALLLTVCVLISARMVPYPLERLLQGVDYWAAQSDKAGTDEEMTYDYLQRLRDWDAIVEASYKETPQSLSCQYTVLMAKWNRKQIGDEELKRCLSNTNQVLTSCTAALMMSDLYLRLGFINMSQRTAFEAMEGISNYNKSGRSMMRLVETALVTGQTAVALKYITLLEQTLFYHGWAQQMRGLALHPERIGNHPVYGPLRQIWEQSVDVFFY